MKRLILGFLAILLMVGLNGCSSDIDIVKNGTLKIDNSLTVGEAFDNYKYFSSTSWKTFKTSNGRKVVEVKCKLTNEWLKIHGLEGKIKNYIMIVQFVINKDNSFKIASVGMDITENNGKKTITDSKSAHLTNQQLIYTLKGIYNNSSDI